MSSPSPSLLTMTNSSSPSLPFSSLITCTNHHHLLSLSISVILITTSSIHLLNHHHHYQHTITTYLHHHYYHPIITISPLIITIPSSPSLAELTIKCPRPQPQALARKRNMMMLGMAKEDREIQVTRSPPPSLLASFLPIQTPDDIAENVSNNPFKINKKKNDKTFSFTRPCDSLRILTENLYQTRWTVEYTQPYLRICTTLSQPLNHLRSLRCRILRFWRLMKLVFTIAFL